MIVKVIKRIGIYGDEVLACFRLGTRLGDSLQLVHACMAFHAANILGLRPRQKQKRFSITLDNLSADLALRSYSGDIFVFQEVLGSRGYRISNLVADGGVIVDLGANIGLTALFFVDQHRPKRLVCVEPNPNNLPVLRHNLAGLGDAATIVHGAIADETGTVFFDSEATSYGGAISSQGTSVPSFSMDEIVRRYVYPDRISLLKVDIEGAEKFLFRGNLKWLKLVDNIVIELHPGVSIGDFEGAVSPFGLHLEMPGEKFGNLLPMAVRTKNPSH